MPQPQQSPEERRKSEINVYAKYGGMAFQFFGACLAGALVGRWLDAKLALERPAFAVLLTIAFMGAAFYALYRQLTKQ